MANDPRFEVYKFRMQSKVSANYHDAFGWRFRAANGQIIAIGGEGFTRREDAESAVKHFLTDVGADHEDTYVTPPIIDVDE